MGRSPGINTVLYVSREDFDTLYGPQPEFPHFPIPVAIEGLKLGEIVNLDLGVVQVRMEIQWLSVFETSTIGRT